MPAAQTIVPLLARSPAVLALPPASLAGFSIPQPPRLTVEPGAVFEQPGGDSKGQAAILLAGGLANLAWMAARQRHERFCSPCCVSMAPLVCQLGLRGAHFVFVLRVGDFVMWKTRDVSGGVP